MHSLYHANDGEDLIYLTFANTQNLHFRVSSAKIQQKVENQ